MVGTHYVRMDNGYRTIISLVVEYFPIISLVVGFLLLSHWLLVIYYYLIGCWVFITISLVGGCFTITSLVGVYFTLTSLVGGYFTIISLVGVYFTLTSLVGGYFTIISLAGGYFTLTSLVAGYLTLISLAGGQILNCGLMVNQWHKSVKTQHTVRKYNKYQKEMLFFIHSYRLQAGHLSCH